MKIKEFNIVEYGPLPERGKFSLGNINLFYGKNESGKTLIIDSLIKFLLGPMTDQFDRINRVNEKPEGYVIINSDDGQNFKFKGKKTINDQFKISNTEFGNLFVIRDSDLSLYKDQELYGNITDRLLGLRINDIEKIKKNLREIGKLTKTGTTFRNLKDEKFLNRIKDAEDYIEKIFHILQQVEDENFDNLEEEVVSKESDIDRVENSIRNYENARNREKYEKGFKALLQLNQIIEDLTKLEVFTEKDKLNWRDYESQLKVKKEKLVEKIDKLNDKKYDLEEVKNDLEDTEKNIEYPSKVNEFIINTIEPELLEYEQKTGDLGQSKEKNKFFNILLILSSLLFCIVLPITIITSNPFGYFLGIIFAVVLILSLFNKFIYVKDKGWVTGFIERLNVKLMKYNLEGESFKVVFQKIEQAKSLYIRLERKLKQSSDSKEELDGKIHKLETARIPQLNGDVSNLQYQINELKLTAEVNSFKDYEEKLELREELERNLETQASILGNHYGFEGNNQGEPIDYWNAEVNKLSKYKEKSVGLKYNGEEVEKLQKEKERLEELLVNLKGKISNFKSELRELERGANEVLKLENIYIHCDTSNDLKILQQHLEKFTLESYNKKTVIISILEIFNEIEIEEREKISKLLTKKSSTSEIFKEITNGDYENIIFEIETGNIKVENRKKEFVGLNALSGGTYDQLFFAIRLGLGKKLLEGKPGFFILDDPFIKSDIDRLTRQIALLKKISSLGWQVLYFTSKNEIKDYFKEDIDNKKINYYELESILG